MRSPVAGYSDTPLAAPITRQSMQSTAREGHVLRRTSVLQRSQQATNTCHSVQSSGIATLIEPPQPLVREPHARTVTCNVARCIVKYRPCRSVPGYHLHPLKGARRGQWSVRVSGNWRVVFRFEGTEAVDVDLIDYH